MRKIASVTCSADDLCEVERVSTAPAFADPRHSDPLVVEAPEPGGRFSEGTLVEFRWQEIAEAALLLVFTEEPITLQQFKDGAIWGAAVPAGARPRVKWQAGHPIQNGKWRDATPALPDPGVYYLLVQAVNGDEVMRLSPLVPFLVGADTEAPWPVPNHPCDEEGVTEQCLHPNNPMVCDGSRCRVLCGSDQDCSGERTCERPDANLLVRMCSR